MKAIVYYEYGTPDRLELREVEKPVPKDDEVLIKVHASSVNSWDWDLLRGKPFLARLGGLLKPQYNILGADVSGVVESGGKNVKELKPGDAVFGDISRCGWGGFGEYVCAREDMLSLKPENMSFEEAAAMSQAAVLALQGLVWKSPIQSGQKVLINGAGGGVGTFAIQLAKSYGAEVTGVDSAGKQDIMLSLGADYVIDYEKEDFTQNGQQYDRVLDVMAFHPISDYRRSLKPEGIYVMVGGATNRIFQLLIQAPWISITSNKKMGILLHKPNNLDLDILKAFFTNGKVKSVIDSYYSLDEVPEALRYFGEGNVKGKIVIRVG
ncbi:MAG: NAD(P)-dependent alcohol dehydrogenase [Bacteroidia bacterium]